MTDTGFLDVSAQEARRLVDEEGALVVDVRTPLEFEELGHIPGAHLLPLDWILTACAAIPREDRSVVVCCEHGIRSTHACRLLAAAGVEKLVNVQGGMSCWTGPREFEPGSPFGLLGPSSWLVENLHRLPREGRALDVACGRGGNALVLASCGLAVRAVDRNAGLVAVLADVASRLHCSVEAAVVDLENGPFPGGGEICGLGREEFDVVLVTHYLHRPLFPALVECLKPGGVLVYETFTVDQAQRSRPTNPDFLLEHGELGRLVSPLAVVAERDGEFDDRWVAGLVAVKPDRPPAR